MTDAEQTLDEIKQIADRIPITMNPVVFSMVKTDMRLWLLYGVVPPHLPEEDLNR